MNQVKDYRTDIRFENRLPDKVNSKLTVKNKVKQALVSLSIFITVALFGAFIGTNYDFNAQNSSISSLEVSLICWSLLLYALLNTFAYFRSPVKFEITWLRFAIHILSSVVFSLMLVLLKLDVFGDVSNSASNPSDATSAIRLYAIIDSVFSIVILSYLFIVAILNRRQHLMQLKITIFGTLSLIILAIAPFLIQEYSKDFKIGSELIFLIASLVSIALFVVMLTLFGMIQSYESSKLKNVNKFIGATTTVTAIAAILGVLIHKISEVGVEFKTLTIVSLVLAFTSFLSINLYLLFFKKVKKGDLRQNSLVNKLLVKGYIIFNLVFSIVLIFLVSKTNLKNASDYSVMIATFPIALIALTLLILQLNNVIIFVRWEIISIIANLLLAFLFILMQGVMFTIPDKQITESWLGRGIWFLILGIYLITELAMLAIEMGSLFIRNNSVTSNNKTIKNKGNR